LTTSQLTFKFRASSVDRWAADRYNRIGVMLGADPTAPDLHLNRFARVIVAR